MEKELLNLILMEIREIKGDMSEVKTRLTNLEERMTNLEERMTNVEDLGQFNKETAESIKNVVTSHYMEFKKYIKINNAQHNVYNAKLLQYNKEN